MRVSYLYRGVKTILNDDFNSPSRDIKGNLNFNSGYKANKKEFTVVIEPHELLEVAEKCLRQLNDIARTNYVIMSDRSNN